MSFDLGGPGRALAVELVGRLTAAGETVSVAESLTGGLVTASLTEVPGASVVVTGAVVAYDSRVKVSLLDVDADLLEHAGAVDPEVAQQMAGGVRERMGTTYGLATTGVAGPDPSDGKPVGAVYVAVAGPASSRVWALDLAGGRAEIRAASVEAVLRLLVEALDAAAGEEPDPAGG